MPRDISRETRIHLALWRKAFRDEGLEITLADYSQALSLRLAMYRAIKPFRSNEFLDPELYEAGEKYCIGIPDKSNVLKITDRKSLLAAENLMTQLGIDEMDLLSPEEKAMQMKLLGELGSLAIDESEEKFPPPASAPNSFFSRD